MAKTEAFASSRITEGNNNIFAPEMQFVSLLVNAEIAQNGCSENQKGRTAEI